MIVMFPAAFSMAHSVALWAEVKEGRVYVEAFFSGGSKVVNGQIMVVNSKGEELHRGKTDKEGKINFKPVSPQAMTIILKIDNEHGAEFLLKKEDFIEKEKCSTPSEEKLTPAPEKSEK